MLKKIKAKKDIAIKRIFIEKDEVLKVTEDPNFVKDEGLVYDLYQYNIFMCSVERSEFEDKFLKYFDLI